MKVKTTCLPHCMATVKAGLCCLLGQDVHEVVALCAPTTASSDMDGHAACCVIGAAQSILIRLCLCLLCSWRCLLEGALRIAPSCCCRTCCARAACPTTGGPRPCTLPRLLTALCALRAARTCPVGWPAQVRLDAACHDNTRRLQQSIRGHATKTECEVLILVDLWAGRRLFMARVSFQVCSCSSGVLLGSWTRLLDAGLSPTSVGVQGASFTRTSRLRLPQRCVSLSRDIIIWHWELRHGAYG